MSRITPVEADARNSGLVGYPADMPDASTDSRFAGPTDFARRAVGKVRRTLAGTPAAAPGGAPNAARAGRQAKQEAKRQAAQRRLQRSHDRLAQILLRDAAEDLLDKAPNRAQMTMLRKEAVRQRAYATYARLISEGASVEEAGVVTVRELAKAGDRHLARAFVLGNYGDNKQMHDLGLALVFNAMNEPARAFQMFSRVDRELIARLVPVEAVTVALRDESDEATELALWVAAQPGHSLSDLAAIAPRLLVTGHTELAQRLADQVEPRKAELSEHEQIVWERQAYWFSPAPVEEPPAGALRIGVIDYHQPDQERASRNLGDYVQTLAMLGNLARFRGIRFSGGDGLGDLANVVHGRIRPELHLDSPEREVHLVRVSRDFSDGDPIPEDTWMVAFGWHMHSSFLVNFGLPYHQNIKPIFVSFHVNRVDVLDEPTLDYLRANGPIGCRDWTTADLLLSAGVDAFFTGCLTTTVSAAYPDLDQVQRSAKLTTAVVDMPEYLEAQVPGPKTVFTHVDPINRSLSLVEGTQSAMDLLDVYQRDYSDVVTSRLHSYLPATSIGIPVDFIPTKVGDVRFDGLFGMKPGNEPFVAMRDGIRELLAGTFDLVFGGADEETVRAHWREVTASRVEEAKRRLNQPSQLEAPALDIEATVAAVKADTFAYGPHDTVDPATVTDIAMSLDANFKGLLPVTVQSVVDNASGPIRLWVTARGLDEEYRTWFHQAFPELPVTFLGCDHVDYGEIKRMIGHITVATMDRLLLPVMLPELDRITYIDIDTVTEGDACELAATDLKGNPLAGRPGRQRASVMWRLAGDPLSAERASDLRRTLSARHAFDFTTVNCGVLVLDLAQMRADDFVAKFVPMAGLYGFNDQDILNAYAGHNRIELDPRWNSLPVLEEVGEVGVGIIHYAGAGKPWSEALTPNRDKWLDVARRLEERVGPVPA